MLYGIVRVSKVILMRDSVETEHVVTLKRDNSYFYIGTNLCVKQGFVPGSVCRSWTPRDLPHLVRNL